MGIHIGCYNCVERGLLRTAPTRSCLTNQQLTLFSWWLPRLLDTQVKLDKTSPLPWENMVIRVICYYGTRRQSPFLQLERHPLSAAHSRAALSKTKDDIFRPVI